MDITTWAAPSLKSSLLIPDPRLSQIAHRRQLSANSLEGWYTAEDSASENDPAREAYEAAVEVFRRELTKDECKKIWLGDKNSMSDVQQAIQQARSNYESSSRKSKAREWLSRCATRIVYYGNVMDVIIQGCPEYASFAWGALKFLFIAITNHEELLTEISKAITKIADVLPRAELLSVLYPTKRMKTALSELYAHIIHFVQLAVKYYKSGRVAKSLAAVTKPFSIKYNPVLDDIRDASRRIYELANSAMKAELRDLHIQVRHLTEITLGVTVDLTRQRRQYEGSQIEMIQDLPIFQRVPYHEGTLEYCRSMTSRRRKRLSCSLSYTDVIKLKTWFENRNSAILIGEAHGVKTSSRDFAVDLLNLVRPSSLPVVWVLPERLESESVVELEDVMAGLVLQILELNPTLLSTGVNPISTRHFRTSLSVEQWLQLLRKSMQGMKQLLIVLDFTILQATLERSNMYEPEEFLEAFLGLKSIHGPIIKIVALTWKLDHVISGGIDDRFVTELIATDPGPRKVRLMRNPKFRAVFSSRRQKLAVALKESSLVADYWKRPDKEQGPTMSRVITISTLQSYFPPPLQSFKVSDHWKMSASYTARQSKTLGAILGVHCGDSLGATLEFKPWSWIKKTHPNGLRQILGGGVLKWPPGNATDDTDLTRAVLLAYRDFEEYKAARDAQSTESFNVVQAAAEYAVKWNEGDWPGRSKGSRPNDIGNTTKIGLRNYKRTKDTAICGAGAGQAGNGSLMRCIPTGLFATGESRKSESIAISGFTHNDTKCTISCAVYNEIVDALVNGKTPQEAVEIGKVTANELGCMEVADAIKEGETLSLQKVANEGPRGIVSVSGFVLNSLKLAVAAVLDARSFEDVLVDLVRLGGDTDTHGAIAGGLLGAREGIEKIPASWLEKLQFRGEFEQVVLRILQLQETAGQTETA
ncbi:unnamed protein product [Periconia digitata]|uniref:ADP-ribosylhydrolase ARH3 n=1 Tax=Periconia digitata TaxID=1303443 RepID=A0A9W4U4D3_9PLEO|nr:unnamed protein product [Periconia digitata]